MALINYYSVDATTRAREYLNPKSCNATVFTGVAANVTYCVFSCEYRSGELIDPR